MVVVDKGGSFVLLHRGRRLVDRHLNPLEVEAIIDDWRGSWRVEANGASGQVSNCLTPDEAAADIVAGGNSCEGNWVSVSVRRRQWAWRFAVHCERLDVTLLSRPVIEQPRDPNGAPTCDRSCRC
ncbi:hypothetical protein [Nannocystis exedens]|uniref:hypothetical protein n=1 Tax=Nannocystis exedens TaxID=54 RepID=UPI001B7FF44A|nr:hypothetical protein [Nannocystis exedens]